MGSSDVWPKRDNTSDTESDSFCANDSYDESARSRYLGSDEEPLVDAPAEIENENLQNEDNSNELFDGEENDKNLYNDDGSFAEIEEYLKLFSVGNSGGLSRKPRKRGRGRPHSQKQPYNKQLSALFGQANLAYTRSEYSKAVELLHKVVKSAPHAPQAWMTLAMIHEELGNKQKALQTYLVAAHMSPKDIDQWKRLGTMSVNFGYESQALYCYSRALMIKNSDTSVLKDRAQLFIRRNQHRRAISDLQTILRIDPGNLDATRNLAFIYERLRNTEQAIGILENLITNGVNNNPNLVIEHSDLRYLAKLYISRGTYENSWEILCKGIANLVNSGNDMGTETHTTLEKLSLLPVEAKTYFAIILLRTNHAEDAETLLAPLFDSTLKNYVEERNDLVDTYMFLKDYTKAITILKILNNYTSQCTETLYKMAKCYEELDSYQKAIELYRQTIELDNNNQDAKLALAKIYTKIGMIEMAKTLTSQVGFETIPAVQNETTNQNKNKREAHSNDQIGEIISLSRTTMRPDSVIYDIEESEKAEETLKIYMQMEELYPSATDHISRTEYLKKAYKLIKQFQTVKEFYPTNFEMKKRIFSGIHKRQKPPINKKREQANSLYKANDNGISQELLSEFLEMSNEFKFLDSNYVPEEILDREDEILEESLSSQVVSFRNLTFEQWYNIFIKTAYMAEQEERHDEAKLVLKISMKANVFYLDEEKMMKLRLHLLTIQLRSKNIHQASDTYKSIIQNAPYCNDVYRLYPAVITTPEYMPHTTSFTYSCMRFLLRISTKFFPHSISGKEISAMECPAFLMTMAYMSHFNKSFRVAIAYSLKAYILCPGDPIINLFLGISYLHLSMQRKTKSRNTYIINAFTFIFRYYNLRGGNMEANYNVARAYHHIGLTHLAIIYYQKVLDLSGSIKDEFKHRDSLVLDSAYNLSRIYIQNGSLDLAYLLMSENCVI